MGIMASHIQVDLRRQKVKHLLAMGIPTVRIAEQLGVHRHTIERDIETLKEDIVESMHKDARRDVLLQIEARKSLIEQYYWRLYYQADTLGERLSVLKQIQHLFMDWVGILGKLGVIEEILSEPLDWEKEEEEFRKRVLRVKEWEKERHREKEQQIQGATV